MSRAAYTLTNKTDNQIADVIEFDLLDNPGCRAWQYAVLLNDKSRSIHYGRPAAFHSPPPENIQQRYQEFKKVINQLADLGFVFDQSVPDSFVLVTQDFMNQAHRHFTNCCQIIWSSTYTDFDLQARANSLLQTLNSHVHFIESYVATPNKIKYSVNQNLEIYLFNDGKELGYDMFPFRQYHSYDHADLILDPYILGKTLIESFLCDDDPSHWDTTGHVKTNGGACILLDNHRQRLYGSQEFNQWLDRHRVNKNSRFADFPLGNFVPGHKQKLQALKKGLGSYNCSVSIKLS